MKIMNILLARSIFRPFAAINKYSVQKSIKSYSTKSSDSNEILNLNKKIEAAHKRIDKLESNLHTNDWMTVFMFTLMLGGISNFYFMYLRPKKNTLKKVKSPNDDLTSCNSM